MNKGFNDNEVSTTLKDLIGDTRLARLFQMTLDHAQYSFGFFKFFPQKQLKPDYLWSCSTILTF